MNRQTTDEPPKMNDFAPALAAGLPHELPRPAAERTGAAHVAAAEAAAADDALAADDRADLEDVRLTLAGDQNAYSRLMERHTPALGRQMWRFSRDPATRDELVQEAFVETFFSLKNYRSQAPFRHWLRTIATRTGYHYWRKQEKQPRQVPLEDWDGADPRNGTDASALPAGRDEAAAAGAILFRLLEQLKAADRVVLTLMYYEDCTVEEIAQRMDWTKAMVKMRAYRARRRLKALIERRQAQEPGLPLLARFGR